MVQNSHCSGVILSPRHLGRAALAEQWVPQLLEHNTPFLLDPQCYDPEYTHPECPLGLGGCLLDQQRRAPFVGRAMEYQANLGVSEYIVPGICSKSVTQNWLNVLDGAAHDAEEWLSLHSGNNRPLLSTVAISIASWRGRLRVSTWCWMVSTCYLRTRDSLEPQWTLSFA